MKLRTRIIKAQEQGTVVIPMYAYNGIQMKSQIEVDFAHYLELLRLGREILEWQYEPFKLDLAPNLKMRRSYTPDFLVIEPLDQSIVGQGQNPPDNRPVLYEVKGWTRYREKGIAKFEAAANLYINEYRFIIVEWVNKNWEFKELE